jgi:DNA polymerase bacteriophage-type
MKLWLDLETRSPIPIKRGVALYSTKVEIIMAQWAVDDGRVMVEDLTSSPPPSRKLLIAAQRADEIWAHGAEFEQHALDTVDWWPLIDLSKWRCTMALARMHGLPGGLEKLSTIFKLGEDEAKDHRGQALIQIFCIPRKDGGYNDRFTHPVEWAEFKHYGAMDITSMRVVHSKIPKWNSTPRMWSMWHLDQRMNKRGVAMDLKLAAGAADATQRAKTRLAARAKKLSKINTQGLEETESALGATTQRDRLLAYMADFGVLLPDLTADTVERRLEDEALPVHIKELLRIRQKASKASTAKYKRVLSQHVHGRLRNLLVFCGAMRTGRWAGRTLQPQNLPRPKHPQWDIDEAIKRFSRGDIEAYAEDDVLELGSSCLRGLIIAEPGNKLVVSDLANIEGRFMAWIAGEQWKLDAYAAYDRKEGPDTYKLAYARPFGIDPNDIADEGDQRRQIGKVMELALQYYGGVGAFCSMAETYGLRLESLAEAAWPVIPADVKADSLAKWNKCRANRRYGLDQRVWMVCQSLVTMWRRAHPKIVKFWELLDTAIKCAVAVPNKEFKAGKRITVDRKGNWLRIKLPSGRYLSYPAPRSADNERSFLGVDPYTKQWKRISTYSGKDAENVVQGGCADILMDGLLAADEANFNPVLSVHDEGITEPPDEPEYNDRRLSEILVTASSQWACGLPLAAKGFTAYRYRK